VDFGVLLTSGAPYVILPPAACSLAVKLETPLSYDAQLSYLRGLARALASLERCGMINRDIKPGNLLIRPDGALLLSDMGAMRSAAISDASTISLQGTRGFLAPGMIEGKGHDSCACDMWSAEWLRGGAAG
jgi:serine/threonine protein kinase